MSAPIPQLPKHADECRALLARFDAGDSIWSLEMGGLGPGYEQCIQVMAVEFTRAAIDLPLEGHNDAQHDAFRESCDRALKPINESLGGVSGAQFGAAMWLAWQWLHGHGPQGLQDEARRQGEDRGIQVSSHWPRAATGEKA